MEILNKNVSCKLISIEELNKLLLKFNCQKINTIILNYIKDIYYIKSSALKINMIILLPDSESQISTKASPTILNIGKDFDIYSVENYRFIESTLNTILKSLNTFMNIDYVYAKRHLFKRIFKTTSVSFNVNIDSLIYDDKYNIQVGDKYKLRLGYSTNHLGEVNNISIFFNNTIDIILTTEELNADISISKLFTIGLIELNGDMPLVGIMISKMLKDKSLYMYITNDKYPLLKQMNFTSKLHERTYKQYGGLIELDINEELTWDKFIRPSWLYALGCNNDDIHALLHDNNIIDNGKTLSGCIIQSHGKDGCTITSTTNDIVINLCITEKTKLKIEFTY